MATYYGAVVSRQQLDQVERDQERRSRQQASRITMWTDPYGPEGGALHIANRSPDAATGASAVVVGEREQANDLPLYVIHGLTLPPCSDLVLQAADIATDRSRDRRYSLADGGWSTELLLFTDASGRRWQRTADDLEETPSVSFSVDDPERILDRVFPKFAVAPLEGECGYV
ncbi:hypothetical protein [Streptomyces coelicoflavus]|uniref:hypothetical protein n=1 Tax=Streptomyces coelicoflavus TaxID=285562 RepID=UPI002E26BA95